MTFSGIFLRFVLGGSAVAATLVVGRRLGGRIGGIFAAFPAVYASAVISAAFGLPRWQGARTALAISHGALVGMIINVGCAFATAWLVSRLGWRRGLALSLSGWLVTAGIVFAGGAAAGWLK